MDFLIDKPYILLRYFISTLVIFLVAAKSVYAQREVKGSNKIDSLQHLADRRSGTQQVDMLNRLANEWFNFNYEIANEQIAKAIKLSEKLNYDKGLGEALIYKGAYERFVGHPTQSSQYFVEGITLSRRAGDKRMEGYGLMHYGNTLLSNGKKDSALLLFQQAYEVLRDSLYPRELSILYKNWSRYYNLQSDFGMQKEYLFRALRIREKMNDATLLLISNTDLATYYDQINKPDSAAHYLQRAEILMSTLKDENTRGGRWFDFMYAKAVILARQSRFKEALMIFSELKENSKSNASLQKQASQLIDVGSLWSDLGNYELAIENYYEGLRVAEEYNYQFERTRGLWGIGFMYYQLDQPVLAQTFARRSLKEAVDGRYKIEEATAYNLLGLACFKKNVFDSALLYYQQALLMREQSGDTSRIAATLYHIGNLFAVQGKAEVAIPYFQRILAFKKSTVEPIVKAATFRSLGRLYLKLGNTIKSIENFDKAELIANEIDLSQGLMLVYKDKADLYKGLNRNKEALDYFEKYEHLKDSLSSSTFTLRIEGLKTRYELKEKDQEILLLNKENALKQSQISKQQTIILFVIGGVVLLLLLSIILYRNYKVVDSLNKSIKEQNKQILSQSEELMRSNQALVQLNAEIEKQKDIIQAHGEERYRRIFNNSILGMYQSTPDGKFITVNPAMAKMFGYDSAEEMKSSVTDISAQIYVRPYERAQLVDLARREGKVVGYVFEGIKKNNEIIYVRQNAQIVYTTDGRIDYFEGIFEDITDKIRNENLLVRKNEELLKVNTQMERFLYSASHDLRSPVSSILGLINVCRFDVKDEVVLNYVSKIETSANKLDKVIRDIADFSKAGYKNILCEEIDFKGLVDKIISRYKTDEMFHKINIDVRVDDQVPFYSDTNILEIVLENLFRNSITFYDPGKNDPCIKIQIQTSLKGANMVVTDNGIGIGDTHIENIFKMFYRGSDRSKGAGLGLFIAKESLQRIGGSITTESSLGLGTSFHIQVPNGSAAALV